MVVTSKISAPGGGEYTEKSRADVRASSSRLASAFAPRGALATPAHVGLARGEYLVRAVGRGECHTPRGMAQAPTIAALAGNPKGKGPEGSEVPNITPDMDTGIGKWTEEQITTYISTGNMPNGDVAGGLMGEVIQGSSAGYKDMTKADLVAIARYLKSIPAIKNKIGD